jgi:hypothetical protein
VILQHNLKTGEIFMEFIKNLIAGIVGFITGLFAKKNDGYFLQLKEEATEAVATATAKVKSATTESVKATAAKVESATVESVKAPAAKAKTSKVEPAKVEPAKPPVPTETTFAPKYLIPSSSNGRRRPGANMSSYLDMARQVKTPG